MNWRAIRTIALKDLAEVRQNRGAWVPALIVPLFFVILLPLAVVSVPGLISIPAGTLFSDQGLGVILERMPPFVLDQLTGLDERQAFIMLVAGYLLAPFFLIMPLMFSSIVGAESFAGEKERKTVEALIYTPVSDGELFLGKVLASVVPAVVLAWLSFLVYGVVLNAAGWPVMGRFWFPKITWWPLMFWLVPAIATLGMAVTVLISSRASTFMEAYQLSSSLVIIALAFVAGQVSGFLFLSVGVALLVGLLIWVIDALLIYFGIRTFARDRLLSRL